LIDRRWHSSIKLTVKLISIWWLQKLDKQTAEKWWCSWLRHCATSWKVAVAILDGVIRVFHWLNLFALWSWVRLRDVPWGKGSRCVGLRTLPHSCAVCLEILGFSAS
jgi:hypothetical protein